MHHYLTALATPLFAGGGQLQLPTNQGRHPARLSARPSPQVRAQCKGPPRCASTGRKSPGAAAESAGLQGQDPRAERSRKCRSRGAARHSNSHVCQWRCNPPTQRGLLCTDALKTFSTGCASAPSGSKGGQSPEEVHAFGWQHHLVWRTDGLISFAGKVCFMGQSGGCWYQVTWPRAAGDGSWRTMPLIETSGCNSSS